jgi:hypothetical protein
LRIVVWQAFADKLVEVVSMEDDYVWLHDYHLLALPSLLRKRFNRIRLGLFLHSPFPSSEVFRTFPRREEILRSLLNTDLLGAGREPSDNITPRQGMLDSGPFIHCSCSRCGHLRPELWMVQYVDATPSCSPQEGTFSCAVLCCDGGSGHGHVLRHGWCAGQGSTRLTTLGISCRAARACWGWSTLRPGAPSA